MEIIWRATAKCKNREVNDFVAQAVAVCAGGDYDEYRLLWSYDHQPTSRKRFAQIRDAMKKVEIKTVKRLRLRLADGGLKQEDSPVYVFHAFIEMKDEAKQRSDHRIDDRDMILRIVYEHGAWRFTPAPKEVKEAILDAVAASQDGSPPRAPPTTRPIPPSGAD